MIVFLTTVSWSVKQTTNGETYNCVDFYEQPAFDHPLLKDNKFNFQPSSSYSVDSSGSSNKKQSDIWLNGKGCPIGTVPIRKTTRDDLSRAESAAETVHTNTNDNLHPQRYIDDNPNVHVAVLRTSEEKKYYGAGMITSVYNFAVSSQQYSSSRIKLQNGPDSIVVGWTINPGLYGDNATRHFIYTSTKDSHCYNTLCPGFILMSPDTPFDSVLQVSEREKNIRGQKFFVRKDAASGDWVLQIGLDNTTVGTWPQKIFSKLNDSATYVDWGGEAYSASSEDLPPMGSGFPPMRSSVLDGYGRQVTLVDENQQVDYNPPECVTYTSDNKRYKIFDEGNVGGEIQRLIVFGGSSGPA
ncbi:unnamed protein product [Linum tenue]|uniref:Neprosin PEP catalytic domain-containing protein n=1 Tax=Linum tenue TaxID=586396 RepID=A0AAV0QFC9_9ROSI|nr:unnamed protein product [Linum tenue]